MIRLRIVGNKLTGRYKQQCQKDGTYIPDKSGANSTAPSCFGDAVESPQEAGVEKRLMNVRELSEYIGTTKGSLYEKIFKGKIPDDCIVKMGRSVRFDRAAIDAWIDRQKLSAHTAQPFR